MGCRHARRTAAWRSSLLSSSPAICSIKDSATPASLASDAAEGLNVVEAFNGANSVIYCGKGGEIASNRHDDQEMTVLCLRILQAALVYVNTLMLRDILDEADWAELPPPKTVAGSPRCFWRHVLPNGEVKLDMTARLSIRTATPNGGP